MSEDSKKTSGLRETISKELYAERLMQKLTQSELAERVGTQKSNISRIEKGAQNLTVDYLEELAKALNKQVRFIMEEPSIEYGDVSTYSLKLYDTELLRFSLKRGLDLKAEILYINKDTRHLLPMDLEPTGDGLISWLTHRTIPQNREFACHILGALGLNFNDLKGILDVCMGLSLNDSYWAPQAGFTGTFAEYNLYENRFSEALSLIAYTGGNHSTKNFRTSPELTTGGMLRKAWRYFDSGDIWLYKGGTEGFANAGNEPYSEFYASQIAERMGLHHVHYDLARWKGILASKCRLFTNIDTAYVPAGRIVKNGGIEACLDHYKTLGGSFYQELASMLVFDAVIVNEDRHFGNFGLLRDNKSGEIISPAPVFDNGLSLLCYAMKANFEDIERYIGTRSNPYGRGNEYFSLCSRIIGPKQKKELSRLIGFKFMESDISNLPSWRLSALEEMIQARVRTLLAL